MILSLKKYFQKFSKKLKGVIFPQKFIKKFNFIKDP